MPRKKKNVSATDGVRKGDAFMKQMGLFDNGTENSSSDDDNLEAELLRLEGKEPGEKRKPKSKKALSLSVIEKLAADIDVTSDTELSGDEDELMKELEGLASGDEEELTSNEADPAALVTLLEERSDLYKQAVGTAEGMKKKRCERGLKTLQSMLRDVKAGKPVDENEIPPAVKIDQPAAMLSPSLVVPSSQSTQSFPILPSSPSAQPTQSPVRPASGAMQSASVSPGRPVIRQSPPVKPPAHASSDPKISMLMERRRQYHAAALEAKRLGDITVTRKYLRVQKDFDHVIEALNEGREVDLSNIPSAPSEFITQDSHQGKSSPKGSPGGSADASGAATSQPAEPQGNFLDNVEEPSAQEAQALFKAPEAATDTLGALMQRLQKYKDSESEAREQGNSSKCRRMGRIAKQYEDTIKCFKAGKPTDFSELPSPPGFAPIPLPTSSKTPILSAAPVVASSASAATPASAAKSLDVPAAANRKRSPSPSQRSQQQQEIMKSKPKRQASLSIQEKQLADLKTRQSMYKKAALDAKTHDDKELALKYMRICKGMDPMIHAATNGLPVDMSQIPPPPMNEHETGFVVVDKEDISEISPEERAEEFKKIESELKSQIQSSVKNSQYFKKIGDLKNEFKFQNMEQNCRKDLASLKNAFTHNDPVPKYHYENRQYSTVVCNTELGDGDLEVSIIRGIQYPMPPEIKEVKDLDTQVFYDFPFPQEEGQKGHTDWFKHSDNPEYNFLTKLRLERKSKSMLRVFKNKKLKFELFYRRGFLRADKHFATVIVKLDAMESKATVHESYDLLDTNGRKEIGGKLEIKLRMREPLSQKQVEIKQEKWLVIDQFVRLELPVHTAPTGKSSKLSQKTHSPSPPVKIQSIEVLKFEKKELDAKIRQLANQLSPNDLARLTQKSAELATNIDLITAMMKRNQLSVHDYIQQLSHINQVYHKDIMTASQSGDRKRMQLLTVKKDVLSREIKAWQMRQKI